MPKSQAIRLSGLHGFARPRFAFDVSPADQAGLLFELATTEAKLRAEPNRSSAPFISTRENTILAINYTRYFGSERFFSGVQGRILEAGFSIIDVESRLNGVVAFVSCVSKPGTRVLASRLSLKLFEK